MRTLSINEDLSIDLIVRSIHPQPPPSLTEPNLVREEEDGLALGQEHHVGHLMEGGILSMSGCRRWVRAVRDTRSPVMFCCSVCG